MPIDEFIIHVFCLVDGTPVQAWNKWGESPLTLIVYFGGLAEGWVCGAIHRPKLPNAKQQASMKMNLR